MEEMLSINSLLEGIKNNKPEAFNEYCLRVKPIALRYFPKDSPELGDIYQDCCTKGLEVLKKTPKKNISRSYFKKIVRSCCVDKQKKEKRQRETISLHSPLNHHEEEGLTREEIISDPKADIPGGKQDAGLDTRKRRELLSEREREGLNIVANYIDRINKFRDKYQEARREYPKELWLYSIFQKTLQNLEEFDHNIKEKAQIWEKSMFRPDELSEEEKQCLEKIKAEDKTRIAVESYYSLFSQLFNIFLTITKRDFLLGQGTEYDPRLIVRELNEVYDGYYQEERKKIASQPKTTSGAVFIKSPPGCISYFYFIEFIPELRVKAPRFLYDILSEYFGKGRKAAQKIRTAIYLLKESTLDSEKRSLFDKFPEEGELKRYFESLRTRKYKKVGKDKEQQIFYDKLVKIIAKKAFG